MEEAIIAVLKSLKDPILVVVFAVICALYHLLLKKEKAWKEVADNMALCNKTLERLSTLVETLVYQGRRNGTT